MRPGQYTGCVRRGKKVTLMTGNVYDENWHSGLENLEIKRLREL